ncbi:MAG: recombinase family protein, partial [Candidatus Margulisbacteria bacterium]|nr:recombinase family protein [Candidatus Margulisiibacteriota bacterium]
ISKMCLEGKSIQKIADYLNTSKHKTRIARYFYTKLIRDILRNPIYTGKIVWNKNHPDQMVVGQGNHRPLVSEEDFQKAQTALDQRRTYNHKRKHGHYPLTGLLYCDKCNHRYFGVSNISNHKTGKRDRWYRCSGRQQFNIRCKGRAIKSNDAENIILSAMLNMLDSDKLKDNRWLYTTKVQNDQNPGFFTAASGSTKKALKINQEKQLKLTDLYLNNQLSKETFAQKNEELRKEEEELRASLAGTELLLMERENSREYMDKVREFLAGYNSKKQELTTKDKKTILSLVFKKITIKNSPRKVDVNARISPALYEPFQKIFAATTISRKDNKKCAGISSKPLVAK